MLSSFKKNLLRSGFSLANENKLFRELERLIIKEAFFTQSTQAQIIEKTKTPQQTMSRRVNSLLKDKVLVQTTRMSTGTRGQPGYRLACNPEFAYAVGMAILTDSIALSIMSFNGEIILSRQVKMDSMSVKRVVLKFKELFTASIEELGISEERILGIGVAISGYFIDIKNKMNTHIMLNEWANIDISQLMSEEFKYPVWLENDATAATAGEGIVGIGKDIRNFVYLFISTGFGGGIIINGDVMNGTYGNAGEVGEMIPPKMYTHPNLENLRYMLIKNGVEIESTTQLVDEFDITWPGVNEWIYKVRDSVSLVASAAAALLDTEAIVIGGHIPKDLAELLIKDIEIYTQHRRLESRPVPNITIANTETEPVSTGAASLPIRALCF